MIPNQCVCSVLKKQRPWLALQEDLGGVSGKSRSHRGLPEGVKAEQEVTRCFWRWDWKVFHNSGGMERRPEGLKGSVKARVRRRPHEHFTGLWPYPGERAPGKSFTDSAG
jgi:hypothetical protein